MGHCHQVHQEEGKLEERKRKTDADADGVKNFHRLLNFIKALL